MLAHNERPTDRNDLIEPMITARRLLWTDALLLIAGYVALDWASFFHPL